jgi:ABC-2 type transport system permease protein
MAFPTGLRPEPPSLWIASAAFGWRGLLKIKHVPEMLADVIAIPVVFTLMFTYLFGGALAGSPHRYLQFILPGTLVMAVLLVTVYTGAGLATDRASGACDRFRSLPIWRLAPIAGALLGDLVRYLLAAALVFAVGLTMGFRPGGGAPRRNGWHGPAADLRTRSVVGLGHSGPAASHAPGRHEQRDCGTSATDPG